MSREAGRDKRPVSQHDYARILKEELPKDLRPMILTQFALNCYGLSSFPSAAAEALTALNPATAEVPKPVLSTELTAEISALYEDLNTTSKTRINGPATGLVLSWAMVEFMGQVQPQAHD